MHTHLLPILYALLCYLCELDITIQCKNVYQTDDVLYYKCSFVQNTKYFHTSVKVVTDAIKFIMSYIQHFSFLRQIVLSKWVVSREAFRLGQWRVDGWCWAVWVTGFLYLVRRRCLQTWAGAPDCCWASWSPSCRGPVGCPSCPATHCSHTYTQTHIHTHTLSPCRNTGLFRQQQPFGPGWIGLPSLLLHELSLYN